MKKSMARFIKVAKVTGFPVKAGTLYMQNHL